MTRRARVETRFEDAETARLVAGAVEPDNTAEMTTRVDGTAVVTEVARETTGGLQATVDDYVVNLQVAAQLTAQDGERETSTLEDGETSTPEDGETSTTQT